MPRFAGIPASRVGRLRGEPRDNGKSGAGAYSSVACDARSIYCLGRGVTRAAGPAGCLGPSLQEECKVVTEGDRSMFSASASSPKRLIRRKMDQSPRLCVSPAHSSPMVLQKENDPPEYSSREDRFQGGLILLAAALSSSCCSEPRRWPILLVSQVQSLPATLVAIYTAAAATSAVGSAWGSEAVSAAACLGHFT